MYEEKDAYKFAYTPTAMFFFSSEALSHLSGLNTSASSPKTDVSLREKEGEHGGQPLAETQYPPIICCDRGQDFDTLRNS